VRDDFESRKAVAQLLDDMLGSDGYWAVIRGWPAHGRGRLQIEIVAGEDACPECLVPKRMLSVVLQQGLPAGLVVDEDDLIYPTDRAESQS
jgi:hypothetical protein